MVNWFVFMAVKLSGRLEGAKGEIMTSTKARPFGSLAVAATAAALPMAGAAQAADMPLKAPVPVWVPQWTFTAEGGMLISNYS
jgi:hypothetical protein